MTSLAPRAFTLIEMMLVIALLGTLTLALLPQALPHSARAERRLDRAMDRLATWQVLLSSLRRDLDAATDVRMRDGLLELGPTPVTYANDASGLVRTAGARSRRFDGLSIVAGGRPGEAGSPSSLTPNERGQLLRLAIDGPGVEGRRSIEVSALLPPRRREAGR